MQWRKPVGFAGVVGVVIQYRRLRKAKLADEFLAVFNFPLNGPLKADKRQRMDRVIRELESDARRLRRLVHSTQQWPRLSQDYMAQFYEANYKLRRAKRIKQRVRYY